MKCPHRLLVVPVVNGETFMKHIRHASIGDLCNALDGIAEQLCAGSSGTRLQHLLGDVRKCIDVLLSARRLEVDASDAGEVDLIDMGVS